MPIPGDILPNGPFKCGNLSDGVKGLHIFPYQENANVLFNSALVYELSALKPFAEPLLRQIPHGTDEYLEAKRLLSILDWFLPIQGGTCPR